MTVHIQTNSVYLLNYSIEYRMRNNTVETKGKWYAKTKRNKRRV